jgi:3-dehydroquinate synthase
MVARQLERLGIELGERSSPIYLGSGLLVSDEPWQTVPRAGTAAIVSNPTVSALYGERLSATLGRRFGRCLSIDIPDGEQYKDWLSLDLIFDRLLAAECDRQTVLVALGGGVVGDVAGFAAACFLRGVPFVQVPTTLLAQVDSSVGGKTAINHPRGKNLIGAFYQPVAVVADLDTLDTLPEREFRSGLAEVIKYGPIADEAFFAWTEHNIEALLARDRAALAFAVRRSCEIKATVVAADEREGGLREVLNFGHTFGHAIETAAGYGVWLHGEAVACGMVMATELSVRLGLIDDGRYRRVVRLIERAGLPVLGPSSCQPAQLIELMRLDKKARAGDIRVVLLDGAGRARVQVAREADIDDVLRAHLPAVVAG